MAFQQGLSGLNASARALDVVGNNVANSSTVGFKSSNAHFADLYAASMNGGGAVQVGIGTQLASVFQQFTQGNVTTTNNPLDVAINGGGFFNVTRNGEIMYTRNGQFHADKEGYIINDQDYRLMGYLASPSGEIVMSQPAAIQLDTSNIAPRATGSALGGNARMVLNLNSGEDVPAVSPFNDQDPLTYTYSTAQTVYDTLGAEHVITYFFAKTTTPGEWEVHATLDGANPAAMGTLQFDTNGTLTSTMPMSFPTTGWPITTGAETPLGSGQPNWNIDFTGTTSFAGTSTVNSKYQGGYAQGELSGISIATDGTVLGNYSNGESKKLAQIVLSTFPNPNGLIDAGNNLYQSTSTSGQPLVGVPESGTRGLLRQMAVEDSNVDLTSELVNMITLQRNYQANAQTIRTQDQIMQTMVNLR
ncbi:MAG: flagellar hook protein FlgE [Candidatus Accumulibacter sp.]|jgi:flagellar hook protein FlgE|nr:flagellar hook protein FlgE [Accumulibacter sp.]